MATTKKTKKPDLRKKIIDAYWRYPLLEGEQPVSVYAFCDANKIKEEDFYKHFAGFDAIESAYWKDCVADSLGALREDDDFTGYDSEQKLLAFYFTLISSLQKHRSRLVQCFPEPGPAVPQVLQGMHEEGRAFFKEIVAEGVEAGVIADRKKLLDLYPRALFEQMRFILEYHRKDSSEEFQDTDALIEKSVKLFFDSAGNGVIESALDLARFMARGLGSK